MAQSQGSWKAVAVAVAVALVVALAVPGARGVVGRAVARHARPRAGRPEHPSGQGRGVIFRTYRTSGTSVPSISMSASSPSGVKPAAP